MLTALTSLLAVAMWFIGWHATRSGIRAIARSDAAKRDQTLAYLLTARVAERGRRFEAHLYFLASVVLGSFAVLVASLVSALPLWIGLLGLFTAVFGAAAIEAQVRYGTGRLRDTWRVFRRWLP